ncbi:hypothetical protein QFC21_000123 [Naganishia friedmannii]|uniref:Uncharacterized protein n=1 Tax=Naganishia friedmannii TaxID=89922 RepID=A0ACC2WAM2_9TREE|nr:hypothetical protein QFC21_000123 [Naganishia friedmannii]
MMSSDFTARITLDEWQEYQNLKAVRQFFTIRYLSLPLELTSFPFQNFHRYIDCYSQEQQTLLARIDHLQIENVSLHDKLLTQEQLCEIERERNAEVSGIQSDSMTRRLNRRASLFDGTWTNSLQSTMVSPYPPTVFSPSVSISRARKPTLAVTVPERSTFSLSSASGEQSKSCGAADAPTTSWTLSPSSSTSLKPERRSSSHLLPHVHPSPAPLETFVEDEVFTNVGWADFEWDDDVDPPGTAVSAPAGLISNDAVGNVQYTMVLIDTSSVKFPAELVAQGQRGGHSFIDSLYQAISSQLETHNLSPIADTFMIRMIVHQEEYGNLQDGSTDSKQMREFCLGIQSHMSCMPFEIVPNVRFNDSASAVLSAWRMCLRDGDCQRVFMAVDTSLSVYRDALLNPSANSNTSKLLLLNGDSNIQSVGITCLDVRNVVSAISDSSTSIVSPSTKGGAQDEARWIPPSYSDVAKAALRFDYPRDDSATPLGHDRRGEATETGHPTPCPQPITVPHLPIVHVISEFRGIQELKRQYGQHPCARFHLEGVCQLREHQHCPHLHEELEFTKPALDRYRRYVYAQPCQRGLACAPDTIQTCKLRHSCPWGAECAFAASKRCLFDGPQFQGRGHQPNIASMLYGERTFKEESAAQRQRGPGGEANARRLGSKHANFFAQSISSIEEKEPNLSPQDFQPILIVLRSMIQTNSKPQQLRARVNELIQARFPGIYARLGLLNFKRYSALAEAAGLVEMGRGGEGRDWIALTDEGKQLLTKNQRCWRNVEEVDSSAGNRTYPSEPSSRPIQSK